MRVWVYDSMWPSFCHEVATPEYHGLEMLPCGRQAKPRRRYSLAGNPCASASCSVTNTTATLSA